MASKSRTSDLRPPPNSRIGLASYLDHIAEAAGDLQIWQLIKTRFRLTTDPGASFALLSSLDAAIATAERLGFDRLAPLSEARPVILAINAALLTIPEQTRRKLENPQFGSHRCSRSPAECPLLCSFTTEISDGHILSRVVALRSLILLGVVFEADRSAQLKLVADGLRKAQTLPHPWADLVRKVPRPDDAPERWLVAILSWAEAYRARLDRVRRHGPAQLAFLIALLGLIRDLGRLMEPDWHRTSAAPPIGVILKSPSERGADERGASDAWKERATAEVNTLLEVDPGPLLAEPAQYELAFSPPTGALEAETPPVAAKLDDRRIAYRLAEIRQTLRWSWDHLNAPELEILVRAGEASVRSGGPAAANALFALLALATGMRVSMLARVPIASGDIEQEHFEPSGIWVKSVLRPAHAWTPKPQQRPLLVDSASVIRFALPEPIASALARATSLRPTARTIGELVNCTQASAVEFLSAWLAPLRFAHPNARLTHGRIRSALAVELAAIAQDEAIVHYVAGSEVDVPPIAAYYAAVPIHTLQRAYGQACQRIFGGELRAWNNGNIPNQYAGSQLLPKADTLASFVAGLRRRVERASPRNATEAHNAYCLYSLWMLMAGTGHRPVTDPAESLDVLDLEAGWMVINDKQTHPGKAGRLVPLAPMVTAQLRRYLCHLHSLAASVADSAPELAAALESIVSPAGPRAMPLFFLLNEDGADWKRIGAAELGRSLEELGGLRANVLRHVLAATGVREHWDAELLREMLGHVEHNQPAFGSCSVLSPRAFGALRESLDGFLTALGWRALPSPLPRTEAPVSPGVRLRQSALSPIELGTELRAQAAKTRATDARIAVNAAMHKALAGQPVSHLIQGTVDRMVRAVLGGRSVPWDLASLDRYTRLYRRLVFLKARYALRIALPPRYAELPLEPAAFPSDALSRLRRADELRRRFLDMLFRRTRSLRSLTVTVERAAAEAAASLAIYSYVLDPELLASLVANPRVRLVHAESFGLLAEFTAREHPEGKEVRRHRLHPLSAILFARLARLGGKSFSAAQATKEVLAIARELSASILAPRGLSFARPTGALEWLVDQFKPAARLALPATLAAYQEGVHQAVSLPLGDLVRVLTGKPPGPRLLREIDPPDAHIPLPSSEHGSAPVRPELPRLPTITGDATLAAWRARAMRLHREILRGITHIVRKRDKRKRGDAIGYSRYERQKGKLKSAVERLVGGGTDHPEMAILAARWLVHLCEHGTSEEPNLRASSCAKYYETLARPMLRTCPNVAFSRLNDEALADVYASAIENVPQRHQAYTLGRLKEFHRFLMEAYGFPPVDWLEVAPVDCATAIAVDAGFVCWEEYLAVFRLLLHDPDADERTRHLQAVVWFFIYRYGARVSEAFGLRRKDIVHPEAQPIVLFRNNDYREIKSDAGIRQVPLVGPLLAEERRAFAAWMDHIDEFAEDDSLGAIFADRSHPRELIDRRAIAERITEALRVVTASPRARLHYGRHSFATRCEWLVTLDRLPRNAEVSRVIGRITGPADPEETRFLLLDTTRPSKRGPWAVSLAVGHAWPGTTFRYYTHTTDLLTAWHLEGVFRQAAVEMDLPTLAYAAGLSLTEIGRRVPHAAGRTALSEEVAHTLSQGEFVKVATLSVQRNSPPVLPRKPTATPARLTPELADRALDLAHRRRRIDGLEQTLFLPGPLIRRLLSAELAVREEARYDVADSGWTPTAASTAVRHSRAGRRTPAETARVRELLRRLNERCQVGGELGELSEGIASLWASRYAPTATELVLPDANELGALLRWCNAVGLPEACIEVRVPEDVPNLVDIGRIAAEHGLSVETVRRVRRLRLAQDRVRGLARQRIGFLIRENSTGPLTGMNQFHRVMFALRAYFRAREAGA